MMMWPYPDDGPFPREPRHARASVDPDVRLALDVAAVLTADDRTRHQRITVEAQNRVVLLSGAVDSRQTADTVVALVRGVAGVRDLCDGLRPKGGPAPAQREESRRFDDIVADLTSETPSPGTPVETGARLPGVVVARLVAAACVLAAVLVVLVGWLGVLAVCVVGWAAVGLRARRRRASGDPASPNGPGGTA